ncbi:hypothetical protein DRO58_06505, partial [Candidatus Bathyarchaeota archaeon]
GFEEKFALRGLTRHGISKGDRLILLTGPTIERVRKAASYVRNFIDKYYSGEGSVDLVELPVHDFYQTTLRVKQVLENVAAMDQVIVNLSGGMRIIVLAVFIAVMLLSMRNVKVELETEDSSTYLTIDAVALKSIMSFEELSEEKMRILEVLTREEKALTVAALSKRLRRDSSTIRKHLRSLEEAGLVIVKKRKPLTVKSHPVLNLIF